MPSLHGHRAGKQPQRVETLNNCPQGQDFLGQTSTLEPEMSSYIPTHTPRGDCALSMRYQCLVWGGDDTHPQDLEAPSQACEVFRDP